MSNFFSRLFSSDPQNDTDGLSQAQREAIVDLLHFCMAADQRLLPVESAEIASQVATLNWEQAVTFETFAAQSLERARTAVVTHETRKTALADINTRLATTETKTRAITLCPKLFRADGDFAPVEREIFVEIKQAFGWPV